ncbi:hypothetical protein GF376_04330 [Candidatus Peregrinibacteria bacterium]|nr:hypothetical protein [Candidatus Peregrinibacteria bacterium]
MFYKKFLKNQKIIYLLFFSVIIFLPEFAGAQTFEIPEATNDMIANFFELINLFLAFLQVLLWPIILMIGSLLSNDLLFGNGMSDIILNIWQAVRDFVNIFLILILLFVAIVNIAGWSKEEFQIRVVLPKIAIALIAVNFSFVGTKFVLDTVNVVSTAIFAIPTTTEMIQSEPEGSSDESKPALLAGGITTEQELSDEICGPLTEAINKTKKKIGSTSSDDPDTTTINFDICQPVSGGDATDASGGGASGATEQSTTTRYELTNFGKNLFKGFKAQNVSLILAVEFMKITELPKIDVKKVDDLFSLSISSLFAVVLYVIYGTAFVALFITLLFRVVVLWITIVLSPLIALGLTGISRLAERATTGENSVGQQFITHALIPINISIVLTIGFLIIVNLKAAKSGFFVNTFAGGLNSLPISTLQDLIAGLATAAFIWMAVFDSLDKGRGANFVKGIGSTISGAATGLAKAPLYFPIIPVTTQKGEKKNVGVAALGTLAGVPQRWIQKQQGEYRELFGATPDIKEFSQQFNAAKNHQERLNLIRDNIDVYEPTDKIDKAEGTKLAQRIRQDRSDWARLLDKEGLRYRSVEAFAKALEEGRVEVRDFQQIKEKNPNAFAKPVDDYVKAHQEKSQKAANEAKSAGITMAADRFIEASKKTLQAAEAETNPNKKNDIIRQADSGGSTQQVALTKAAEKANELQIDNKTSAILIEPEQIRIAQDLNKHLEDSGLKQRQERKKQIETLLIDKKGMHPVGADRLAQNIVNGTAGGGQPQQQPQQQPPQQPPPEDQETTPGNNDQQ